MQESVLSSRLGKKLDQPVRVGKAIGKRRWLIVSGVALLVVLFGLQFLTFREQLSETGFAHTQSILTDRGSFSNSLSGSFAAVDQAGNPVVVSRLKGFGFFGSESDSPRVDKLRFGGTLNMFGEDVDWSSFQISGSFKVRMDVVQPQGVSKDSGLFPLRFFHIMVPGPGIVEPIEGEPRGFGGEVILADFDSHMKTAAYPMTTGPYWLGSRPERASVLFTITVTLTASVRNSLYETLTAERIVSGQLPLRWQYEQGGSLFAVDATMYVDAVTTLYTAVTTVSPTWVSPTWTTKWSSTVSTVMTWTTKTSYTTTLTTSSEPPLDKDKGQMSWLPLFRINIVDIRRVS
jgi:hypothetical protein